MNIENLVKGLQIIVEEVSEGKFTVVEKVPTIKSVEEPKVDVEPEKEQPKKQRDTVTEEIVKKEVMEEVENVTGDLQNKTVAELREIAKEMGLPIRGTKSAILGRILEAQGCLYP